MYKLLQGFFSTSDWLADLLDGRKRFFDTMEPQQCQGFRILPKSKDGAALETNMEQGQVGRRDKSWLPWHLVSLVSHYDVGLINWCRTSA